MCLLSSLDKIDVCVELLADYVWEAEDDKTGFFSVGVDNSESIILVKMTNFLAHGENINKTKNTINENKLESSTFVLIKDQNILFCETPLWKG